MLKHEVCKENEIEWEEKGEKNLQEQKKANTVHKPIKGHLQLYNANWTPCCFMGDSTSFSRSFSVYVDAVPVVCYAIALI